jgi:hypothetical protein
MSRLRKLWASTLAPPPHTFYDMVSSTRNLYRLCSYTHTHTNKNLVQCKLNFRHIYCALKNYIKNERTVTEITCFTYYIWKSVSDYNVYTDWRLVGRLWNWNRWSETILCTQRNVAETKSTADRFYHIVRAWDQSLSCVDLRSAGQYSWDGTVVF